MSFEPPTEAQIEAATLRLESLASRDPELREDRARGDGAERLLRRFLRLCESERMAPLMLRMVESAARGDGNGRKVYNAVNRLVLNPVARSAGIHTSALRMELVASQLVGLAMMRYVLEVEPVCSASIDDIVTRMAPAIRVTLKG